MTTVAITTTAVHHLLQDLVKASILMRHIAQRVVIMSQSLISPAVIVRVITKEVKKEVKKVVNEEIIVKVDADN